MGFPPKEFLTVSELAARWERAPLQIIDWAMSGKLELMVSLTEAEFQGGEEFDYAAVRAGHVRPLFRDAGDAERFVMIRRARPPGSDKPLSIVHPAEGVRVLSTDVLIRTTEIERFEEENSLVRRVVVGPGAPTRHSWERFYVEMCCRIFHDGLPDTQTELVEVMQDWIMDDPNWGEAPDPSTIRKKVKVVWQRLKPE